MRTFRSRGLIGQSNCEIVKGKVGVDDYSIHFICSTFGIRLGDRNGIAKELEWLKEQAKI